MNFAFAWSAIAICISLTACGRPRAVAAPKPVLAAATASAPEAVAAREPPADEPVQWLATLASPVCSVAAPRWMGALQLRSGGPPFATISGGPASIALGGAADGSISQAAVESPSLRVRGVLDQPTLFLVKPTLLSQLVVPHASTPIAWTETTTPDRIVVSLDVSDTFEVPKTAEAVVRCDALTGTEPSFDARTFAAPPARKTASLRGDARFVAELGDPDGARLHLSSMRSVEIVASRGDMTRVVIDNPRYLTVGWLPTAQLSDFHVTRGPRLRMGTVQHRGKGERRCQHDIPLIASVGGERAFVGTLPAGASFTGSTLDVEPGFVALTVFETWFRLEGDARLLVRNDDLDGC